MITALNVDMNQHHRWDLAGIDGLQVARSLFGEPVSQIAPFQSLETTFEDCECAVLRLCEGNFRIVVEGDATPVAQALQQAETHYQVWIKQFDWLGAIVLPESTGLALLLQIASTKPPHRLQGLECDRAVPARIEEMAVLIWRHTVLQQPAFELHTASQNIETLKIRLGL